MLMLDAVEQKIERLMRGRSDEETARQVAAQCNLRYMNRDGWRITTCFAFQGSPMVAQLSHREETWVGCFCNHFSNDLWRLLLSLLLCQLLLYSVHVSFFGRLHWRWSPIVVIESSQPESQPFLILMSLSLLTFAKL